jgi:hypothetical protein
MTVEYSDKPIFLKKRQTAASEELRRDAQTRIAYGCWRFDMWFKGHGTYNEIERKVEAGELAPFHCPEPNCNCGWQHDDLNR